MPGKFEIMRAVRGRQDQAVSDWSRQIQLQSLVCARGVDEADSDYGEWLYDVTWLEYMHGGLLVDAPALPEEIRRSEFSTGDKE